MGGSISGILIFALLFIAIAFSGCSSSTIQSTSSMVPPTEEVSPQSNLEEDIDLADHIMPDAIPGFTLVSKGKDPDSGILLEDEYTAYSYWVPAEESEYSGRLDHVSMYVYVYSDEEKARELYTGVWENVSDGSISVDETGGIYRYYLGEYSITILHDNLIIQSVSRYFNHFTKSAGSVCR